MKLTRFVPGFRSFKFVPFAIIALFVFTNLLGVVFKHANAPAIQAQVVSTPVAETPIADTTVVADEYIPADMPTSGNHKLDLIIFRAGARYGVDPRLIHAIIWHESKYIVHARSSSGAQGLMQLMPDTARRLGCANPDDPAANVNAGTKYLRRLLEKYKGNVALALAGYSDGEGAVDRYKGVPPSGQAQSFVRFITSRYGKTYHPLLTPEQARVEFRLLRQNAPSQG
jgi:soluble lytic murein transglycosylase-like protein